MDADALVVRKSSKAKIPVRDNSSGRHLLIENLSRFGRHYHKY
jgi:hypothetical protein